MAQSRILPDMPTDNELDWSDKDLEKLKRETVCLCGVPNCEGHEIAPDGRVYVSEHPSIKIKTPSKTES